MTEFELEDKVLQSLSLLGLETKEVSKMDLEYTYIGLANKYNPKNEDGNAEMFKKVTDAYNFLNEDICRTNEVINNILNPNNKTYFYTTPDKKVQEEVKEEIINEDVKPEKGVKYIDTPNGKIKIVDKPSPLNMVLSLLVPLYGILNFFLIVKFMKRAAIVYLLCAIVGIELNFGFFYLMYKNGYYV